MRTRIRNGNTLLELVAAGAVIAIGLVPALRLLRDTLAIGEEIEAADAMTTLCASRLEETLAKTCTTWNTSSESGNYASIGYPLLKYTVIKSDAAVDGGIPSQLVAVTVTVWDDVDSDGTLDSTEKKVQFASKLAKVASYNDSGS